MVHGMAGLVRRPLDLPAGLNGLVPVCVCICALLCACAEMPPTRGTPPPSFMLSSANLAHFEIGVLVAEWHSGIVLPTSELGALRPLLRGDSHAKYLSFGWGNRRFYMAAHPGLRDAIAALFRSPSTLFVQAVSAATDLSAGDAQIHWVCVDREELQRVESYIEASLSHPEGKPVDLGPGPVPESRFYAAIGHYSAVHTCNTWTVAALQYSRLPVRAGGVIFADQADRRIRALRACRAP